MFKRIVLLCILCGTLSAAQRYEPNWKSVNSRPTPSWFTDAKFGIFIHWGVYSVPSFAPVTRSKLRMPSGIGTRLQKAESRTQPDGMQRYLGISQERLWSRISRIRISRRCFAPSSSIPITGRTYSQRSGAKYVVLTSKHHEGFALWPSKKQSQPGAAPGTPSMIGPQRDLLGDLTKAVRRKGLKMGYLLFALRVVQPALAFRQASATSPST